MKWMMVVTLLLRWSIVSSEAKPNWRPILRMKDLDDDASDKTYYFLGNSVTRSYAFTLCSMLSKIDYIPDRFIQRDLCGNSNFPHPGEVRARGCRAQCGENVSVVFGWKNTVSSHLSSDFRDVCEIPEDSNIPESSKFRRTLGCLRRIFRSARANDVLVVGSLALDDRLFGETHHLHFQHLDRFGELALRATTHADLESIILMLRRAFPGNRVLWHSYPNLDFSRDTKGDCVRVRCDLMYAKINELVDASIRKLSVSMNVSFVSLWDIQARRLDEYDDMIHHSGKLARDIMIKLLQWNQECRASFLDPTCNDDDC